MSFNQQYLSMPPPPPPNAMPINGPQFINWNHYVRTPGFSQFVQHAMTQFPQRPRPGTQPGDDELLVHYLYEGSTQGKTYLHILNEMHMVRNYPVFDWKEYYLDNVRRIDALVATYANQRRAQRESWSNAGSPRQTSST